MVENLFRISYEDKLDMPERIGKKYYRKVSLEKSFHIERINHILSRVEDVSEDDSAVHLDFCLTGYYPRGNGYVCAIWPSNPREINFYFNPISNYKYLFKGFVEGPDSGKSEKNPATVQKELPFGEINYLFFRQNPHLPFRPYFFQHYDRLFNHTEQNDAEIISFHRRTLSELLAERTSKVHKLLNRKQVSLQELRSISEVLNHPFFWDKS